MTNCFTHDQTFTPGSVLGVFTFFFFNATATTEIYTLSLHDALPISGGEHTDPQHTHMDPSACCKLEILCQPAVEHHAIGRGAPISETHRIAGPIEALLVERSRGQVRPFPIAGRHIGTAHSYFELAVTEHKFDLDARCRNSDHARAVGKKMGRGGKRRGFR